MDDFFRSAFNLAITPVRAWSVIARSFNPRAGRAMTEGEVETARSVFGDAIDYSRVRICSQLSWGTTGSTLGSHIFLSRDFRNVADLSKASGDPVADVARRAVLIHELTHVWQAQHEKGVLPTVKTLFSGFLSSIGIDVYRYNPVKKGDFGTLGVEPQAQIVEDLYIARELIPHFEVDGARVEKWHNEPVQEYMESRRAITRPYFPAL